MNYAVVWLPRAVDGLAEAWTAATDRNAVVAAADRMELALADHPLVVGESRSGDFRLTFEGPLQVLFRVIQADRRVEVFRVAHIRR